MSTHAEELEPQPNGRESASDAKRSVQCGNGDLASPKQKDAFVPEG